MKNLLYLSTLLGFIFLLTSCGQISSEDVATDLIKTNYYARYEEADKVVEADGHFLLDDSFGTYVTLDGTSHLKINGNVAKLKTTIVNQKYYQIKKHQFDLQVRREFEFEFVDKEGRSYLNRTSIPNQVRFTVPKKVLKGESLVINFSVDDINDGATSVDGYISFGNGSFYQYAKGNVKNGKLTVSAESLNNLENTTNLTVSLCRVMSKRVTDHPGSGGRLVSSYCASPKTVEIE